MTEQCFVIVENGVVVQRQLTISPAELETGLFIVAPSWVMYGVLYDGVTFTMPPEPEPEPPPPYTLPVAIMWLRMTDPEFDAVDEAMDTATPKRLRTAFRSASSMTSDGELFNFVKGVVSSAITAPRAEEIMAAPAGASSAITAPEA